MQQNHENVTLNMAILYLFADDEQTEYARGKLKRKKLILEWAVAKQQRPSSKNKREGV